MAALLGDVEEALFQALARINPNAAQGTPGVPAGAARTINGATVKYVGRWIGEPIRGSLIVDYIRQVISKEVAERTPAVLLGFEGEAIDPSPNALMTLSGNVETVGLATWTVLVVARDTRATRVVMQGTAAGTAAALGIYDIEKLVEDALVNLGIPGLYRTSNVRYLDARPYILSPGELYVLNMRFQTRRVLADVRETATDPAWGLPPELLELDANLNLYPQGMAGDMAPNPIGATVSFPGGPQLPVQSPPVAPPLRGLLLWLQGQYANGADREGLPIPTLSNNALVPQWLDRYSGRWFLGEASPASQPTYLNGTGLASQSSFRFIPGTRLGGLVDWLLVGNQPRTMAVVVSGLTDTLVAVQNIATWGSLVGTEALQQFDLVTTRDGSNVWRFALGTGGGTYLFAGEAPGVSTAWLVIAAYDGTSVSIRTIPVSGVGSTRTAPLAINTLNDRKFELGRAGSASLMLSEVMIWRSTLTAPETNTLLSWVSARYGINGS